MCLKIQLTILHDQQLHTAIKHTFHQLQIYYIINYIVSRDMLHKMALYFVLVSVNTLWAQMKQKPMSFNLDNSSLLWQPCRVWISGVCYASIYI